MQEAVVISKQKEQDAQGLTKIPVQRKAKEN